MLIRHSSWPIIGALALLSTSVWADEAAQSYPECARTPSEAEVKAAKGAFQAGQASFDEGDYDRAITYWEDAYRRDCTAHAMLLNLARVYELAERKPQAIAALETYLQRDPETPKRAQIDRRIAVLKEKLATEQAVAAPEPAPEPTPPPVETSQSPTPAPLPTEAPPPTGSRPLTPLVVAGAGGIVGLVGFLGYLSASGDVSDWESTCPNRQCPQGVDPSQANDARTRQTTWGAVSLVGLAVAGGGVVWYFTSPRQPAEPNAAPVNTSRWPSFAPAVAPGYAGVQLGGTF